MSVILPCRAATALLTEDAEGALAGVEKAKFAVHLTICGACRAYRSQLETTVAVLHAIRREPAKAEDVDAVLRMLGDAPPGGRDDS